MNEGTLLPEIAFQKQNEKFGTLKKNITEFKLDQGSLSCLNPERVNICVTDGKV